MIIANMAEAERVLEAYIPLVAQLTGEQTTLDRIIPLMESLGNPQDKIRVIHIAGTSGKTSTAYYLSALLQATGSTVGLTVSPHVDSVRERIQIDGRALPEEDFCKLLGEFIDHVNTVDQPPSYFELLYAFAIWVFDKLGVDYAVVETGMGGLYDATNVVTRPDKVCVITDIGFDHMKYLGTTLPEIAAQKAGIIHSRNLVLTYKQSDEIMSVIKNVAEKQGATLKILADPKADKNYQSRNWNLACEAFNFISERDGLDELSSAQLETTKHTYVPARMEIIEQTDKTIIIDGAHNLQKMSAFISSYKSQLADTKAAILIAFKEGKDYQEVLPLIHTISDHVIVTVFDRTQDLPVSATDPQELAAAFVEAGFAKVECFPNQDEAYEALLKSSEHNLIITGSFYMISQLRQHHKLWLDNSL